MTLCRMFKYLLSVSFFICFCDITNLFLPCSHIAHPLCNNEYIIGNFAFKLIDNFVAPMEEAEVVDEIPS